MDLRNTPDGAIAESGDWEDLRDAAADQMTSTAKHALDGCIFGLSPTSAQTHVQIGEAYIDGNRLRLRANEAIDIAALTRPTGSMVAWVTVLASYTTEGSGTVTDDAGVQYVRITNDSIIITLSRGTDAATKAAAVKPSIPTGSIVLCDILLDASTAVGSLTGDPARRPQCPDDELRTESDLQWDAIRALQATQAASLQSPNKGPTPTATSTVALRVDATWAAGTVDTGVPAITKAKFRWRQAGENWSDSRTINLQNVQMAMFSVPNSDSDIQMSLQYGNPNGFGEWSNTGSIDAADIFDPPALTARTFTADDTYTWPYPQSQRARLTLTGGAGGGGAGGGQAATSNVVADLVAGVGGTGGPGEDGSDGGTGGVGQTISTYASGGDGGGPAGGSGSQANHQQGGLHAGAGGGGGEQGAAGDASSVTIDVRSVSESADGGDGGSGGGGGAGRRTPGMPGGDAGDGTGGAGGAGTGNASGDGAAGGDGDGGAVRIADVSGLQVGDAIDIVIGDGGDGGNGGGSASSGTVQADGSDGSPGSSGSVTITPLT